MACIALITGTAYLIEVDKAEARAIWSTKELSLTTSYNATYINIKKGNFESIHIRYRTLI